MKLHCPSFIAATCQIASPITTEWRSTVQAANLLAVLLAGYFLSCEGRGFLWACPHKCTYVPASYADFWQAAYCAVGRAVRKSVVDLNPWYQNLKEQVDASLSSHSWLPEMLVSSRIHVKVFEPIWQGGYDSMS